MFSLTIAQHHRMCLFHLAVEVVLLNAVQADLQTHTCPIIVCSNRQLVIRSRPAYKDLELAPRQDDKYIAAFVFHNCTVFHCARGLYERNILVLSGHLTYRAYNYQFYWNKTVKTTAHLNVSLWKLPQNLFMMMPDLNLQLLSTNELMKRTVSFVLH